LELISCKFNAIKCISQSELLDYILFFFSKAYFKKEYEELALFFLKALKKEI